MPVDQKEKVREQFGVSADAYAKSEVHAKGESLSLLVGLAGPRKEWRALDIATGAGHTALAIAPHVERIVAADITREMLQKASELASSRGIKNFDACMADVESLPFRDASFDMVTCRIALHHFSDAQAAVRETARVLKPGGVFGLDDNIVIGDAQAEEHYNAFEKIRDPSHNRAFTLPALQSMLEGEGLEVTSTCRLSKEVEFHDWADRQHVSGPDKERLMDMLHDLPPALRTMLEPRFSGNTAHFSLWEAVIVGKK
ncbi:MAG TPA: methyltransferase domain-containing protein [Methanocella sp.]|uniref:class I SAM-dependent methyltransferase n=1 Tax=Methanocella sp. TaxID=2052833 RepID=UPI002B74D23B|nr:methyltransferase domain-containing protein [Methanocella sp.]HTY89935.1 methyltransferase domain-containing protein [Methanocella sp.]